MAGQFMIGLTQSQYDGALAKAKAAGIVLTPDGGSLPETDGVSARYTVQRHDSGVYEVTVLIDKKPFYVPVSVIADHVKQLLGV